MAILELQLIRNSLKEKQRQNQLSSKNSFDVKDLTPFNALVRLPKKKPILYK